MFLSETLLWLSSTSIEQPRSLFETLRVYSDAGLEIREIDLSAISIPPTAFSFFVTVPFTSTKQPSLIPESLSLQSYELCTVWIMILPVITIMNVIPPILRIL